MKKLNVGCYKDIKEGYINLDKFNLKGVDVVHDLIKFPYPFEDNTFDEIYVSKVLEHIEPAYTREVMNEFYRISKPNAIIIIYVPYGLNWINYIDHKRGFSFMTFISLCSAKDEKHITDGNFELMGFKQYPTFFGQFIPFDFLRRGIACFLNDIIRALEVRLKVIK